MCPFFVKEINGRADISLELLHLNDSFVTILALVMLLYQSVLYSSLLLYISALPIWHQFVCGVVGDMGFILFRC